MSNGLEDWSAYPQTVPQTIRLHHRQLSQAVRVRQSRVRQPRKTRKSNDFDFDLQFKRSPQLNTFFFFVGEIRQCDPL
jgi:hypothetical protein